MAAIDQMPTAYRDPDDAAGGTMPTGHFTRTTQDGELLSRARHARDVGERWAERLRGTVRENPLAAMASAFAVGALMVRLRGRD